MKKAAKVAAFVLCAVVFTSTLFGCSKLSGTYSSGTNTTVATEYSFEGNRVIISVAGMETEGTYELGGNELVITVGSIVSTHSFEQDGDSIIIDGVELTKK